MHKYSVTITKNGLYVSCFFVVASNIKEAHQHAQLHKKLHGLKGATEVRRV